MGYIILGTALVFDIKNMKMTKKQKELFALIGNAYTTMTKGDKEISILDTEVIRDMATQNAILDIQRGLDVEFEQSYEIMASACDILADLDIEYVESDRLDFFADADSRANVYTAIQLEYLNNNNEAEISELMEDEAITSIAQACSIWHSQKVAEVCQLLLDYILTQ